MVPVLFPPAPMNTTPTPKKKWTTPQLREIPIFFECTCYAGSV